MAPQLSFVVQPLDVETFIAEPAIKPLDETVVDRTTGPDKAQLAAGLDGPKLHRTPGKLAAGRISAEPYPPSRSVQVPEYRAVQAALSACLFWPESVKSQGYGDSVPVWKPSLPSVSIHGQPMQWHDP